MLDMMHYLVGDFNEVIGTSGIIIPKRQKLDGSGLGDVTTEDYFHAMATMENDISATMCFTKFAWGRKNSQRLEIYGSRGGLIYILENGLRGSDHLKVCLGNELALTGDWVDMNLKGFDGVYNTKSQMDCFAEKMLGIKNTIPADIEDGYYIQGINNLYEFDCGAQSGWMYKVNGWFPNYGCSKYTLEDGDDIVWCFTCNGLGADVGAEYNGE